MSDKQKQFVVEKIIKITNSDKKISTLMVTSARIIRNIYPSLNDDEFKKIWDKFGHSYYMDELIKMHCRHLTLEELNDILAFWLSRSGQKLVQEKFIESEIQLGLDWSSKIEIECQKIVEKRSNNGI